MSVGGYWTHFGPSDWYLDGVLQATWYDATMTGERGLRDGETDGWGLAASLEGGYPFHLGDGWLIEPQAQLVYQIDRPQRLQRRRCRRALQRRGFAGRPHRRAAGAQLGPRGGARRRPRHRRCLPTVRQASLWLRGDIWHEFLGQPTTEFSSADGFVPFTADLDGSWWKLGLGGT